MIGIDPPVIHIHMELRTVRIPIYIVILLCLALVALGMRVGDGMGYTRGMNVNQAQLTSGIRSAIYADIESTVVRFGNFSIPGYKVQVAKYTRVRDK